MKVSMRIQKDGETASNFEPMIREFDEVDEINENIEDARERAEDAGYDLHQDIEFGDDYGSTLTFVIHEKEGAKLVGKITGLKNPVEKEEVKNILS